jgi:hypothetical protein
MPNWRKVFRKSWNGDYLHPNSPAGGTGTGFSHFPSGGTWPSHLPHPNSPAGKSIDWNYELRRLDIKERCEAVYHAIKRATPLVPGAIREVTGEDLNALVSGILPGLVMFMGALAASTTLGMGAGAVIGALGFGVGSVPGAMVGAGLGFKAGLVLLNYLGLAFLAGFIGQSLLQAASEAKGAVSDAWKSVETDSDMLVKLGRERASHRFALSVALVFRGVLQGVVAFLLAKGVPAAGRRVPELISKLRASKLGAGFAGWVEVNWRRLIANPRLQGEYVRGRPMSSATGENGGAPFPKEMEPLPWPKTERRPLIADSPSPKPPKDFEGKLRGEKVKLQGVKEREVVYTKRNPQETAKLRSQFNSTERSKFLKEISNNPKKVGQLRKAGLTETEIQKMQKGLAPGREWQVHHKLPLDDGGTNSMDNLILIKNEPYHQTLTSTQNALTKGMQTGETRVIKFPVPDNFVYPAN